jgi:hypothetical protein
VNLQPYIDIKGPPHISAKEKQEQKVYSDLCSSINPMFNKIFS